MNKEYDKLYDKIMKESNHSIKKTVMKSKIEKYVKERYELKQQFIKECIDEGWYIKKHGRKHSYDITIYDKEHELNLIEK